MSTEELREFFGRHSDEYKSFWNIREKLSERSDLHAFLLLDRLCPGAKNMVYSARDGEIFLDVVAEDLGAATEEQLLDLHRCGVRCSEQGLLCMFT